MMAAVPGPRAKIAAAMCNARIACPENDMA
jgi:hypothetical protein